MRTEESANSQNCQSIPQKKPSRDKLRRKTVKLRFVERVLWRKNFEGRQVCSDQNIENDFAVIFWYCITFCLSRTHSGLFVFYFCKFAADSMGQLPKPRQTGAVFQERIIRKGAFAFSTPKIWKKDDLNGDRNRKPKIRIGYNANL